MDEKVVRYRQRHKRCKYCIHKTLRTPKCTGFPEQPAEQPAETPAEQPDAIAPDKIRKEVGWEPETDFETGIRKTIKWYLKNLDWMENITSGEYQNYYKEMYHL